MPDPDRSRRKAAATAATLAWLERIDRTEGYPALVAAVEDAIRSGMAQGEADALALAADRQGRRGFAVIRAFRAAYARLAGNRDVTSRARDALARIRDGAAADAGRYLADCAGDEQDMTAAADNALSGNGSASRWADWALWAAFGAGAMALYRRADATVINWVDAGDSRVCPTCWGNAQGSPYSPGSVPEYPAHPRCRCYLDTASTVPAAFLAAFLG